MTGYDAGPPVALEHGDVVATVAEVAVHRHLQAVALDDPRVGRPRERRAGDDRVGEPVALVFIKDGRPAPAADVVATHPGRVPAEPGPPIRERDSVGLRAQHGA